MKSILRNFIFNLIGLLIITYLVKGFTFSGGYQTLLFACLVLTLMNILIKPILNILLAPINFLSLGMLSWLSNLLILYVLTRFIPAIKISGFYFPGFSYAGFTVPAFNLTLIMVFILISFLISLVNNFFNWLCHK